MTELFSATLTVCIDAGNLSGYLALAPTMAMLRKFDVDLAWMPLASPLEKLSSRQPMAPAADPLAAYKARRARAREQWARRELARDCERLGISTAAGARRFDASLAGMGMMFLGARGGDVPDYLARVYRRAFHDNADITAPDEIAALVGDEAFRVWEETAGRATLDALQDQLVDAGVFSSPAYVFRGEVFQGRQHLPLIESYLRRDA